MKPNTTSNALRILGKIHRDRPDVQEMIEQERNNLDVAHKIIDLRKGAGLSQAALAAKIGTTQSVISRLEDADYDGHSLPMLKRIAAAVGRDVKISFPPKRQLQVA